MFFFKDILFRSLSVLPAKDLWIIWLSSLLTLTLPNKDYSINESWALFEISTFLSPIKIF